MKIIKLVARSLSLLRRAMHDVDVHKQKHPLVGGKWYQYWWDQCKLMYANGVTADDYYLYGLFRPEVSWAEKLTYIGCHERWRWVAPVSPEHYKFLTENKLIFSHFLSATQIPVARVYGTYGPKGLSDDGQLLRTPQQLEKWLIQRNLDNLFIKPVAGTRGVGVLSLGDQIEPGRWQKLPQGEITLPELLEHFQAQPHLDTYLIEERLNPHQEMAKFAPNVLHTARIISSYDEDVCIHAAMMRLAAADQIADNTSLGNMSAAIELATGRLQHGSVRINGIARPQAVHESSGLVVEGFQLPDWQETVTLVQRASRCVHFNGVLAWDVALTDKGPVVIEANSLFDLHWQATASRGLLSTTLYDYMCKHHLDKRIGFHLH
ncbi:sugar-transfer associated ATP-grasp domain-containing protein [Zooshikella ganghwensis]|uniref:sugar-transfer associated ATP-grasp domain-containing protein n=1 Tax=Zooshikella ganghwensis TaxID=202772 RepID=UPI00040315F1|nr:sugar-transfer associated ATP-grasp domain-containing protein [Zooshikella ganghwensis]